MGTMDDTGDVSVSQFQHLEHFFFHFLQKLLLIVRQLHVDFSIMYYFQLSVQLNPYPKAIQAAPSSRASLTYVPEDRKPFDCY